ncbi:PucR family transcriptional regulator [Enemella dayhoffiae]|uniref:PucR family transcriptional regulator n=1 Tax=Enemella dayhoffiae TaxID=2016507 RepID=A0A255HCI5_9ACTN|nr:helix-turn-helix domain-containing protein [Enemella dayhoffiae]OYO25152.1 PucR family transcriptional regulator [Enemella dayhoffiae]
MRRALDLHDLVQDLSEEVGRRLVVLDDRMQVLAYSIHETPDDRRRLSFVLAHTDAWQPLPPGADEEVADEPGLGRRVVWPLHDHRHRVGHLLLVLDPGEEAVPERVRARLTGAAPQLGVTLSLRTLYAARDRQRVQELLGALVGADATARAAAAPALVEEGLIGASEQYCAVALGVLPRVAEAPDQAALAVAGVLDFVAATSTASLAGAALDERTAVLVFPRPVVLPRLERLLQRPELSAVRAGIGPVVGSLEAAHESYARARRAWRVCCVDTDSGPVRAWDSLGLDRLLAMLPLDELTGTDLPSSVQELLKLGPDLVATVERYLSCGGDAQQTARELTIHRSTLYYRLDRVRDRLSVDLADGQVRRELHTGLRIARLAGLVPSD